MADTRKPSEGAAHPRRLVQILTAWHPMTLCCAGLLLLIVGYCCVYVPMMAMSIKSGIINQIREADELSLTYTTVSRDDVDEDGLPQVLRNTLTIQDRAQLQRFADIISSMKPRIEVLPVEIGSGGGKAYDLRIQSRDRETALPITYSRGQDAIVYSTEDRGYKYVLDLELVRKFRRSYEQSVQQEIVEPLR